MGEENRSEETKEVILVLNQVVRGDLGAISLVDGVEDRE